MSSIEAVIFDMDGVLFEGRNFWLDLHRRYGTEDAGLVAAEEHLATDYESLAEIVVGQLWRGKSATPLLELVAARRYQPGAKEVIATLKERGIATAIVSSGPRLLALRAQDELGIDIVRANDLEISDGRLTGRSTIDVPDAGKGLVGLKLLRELEIPPSRVASIGDTGSDASLARLVAMPIAYDSVSEDLDRAAQHHLAHGELHVLPTLLDERPR